MRFFGSEPLRLRADTGEAAFLPLSDKTAAEIDHLSGEPITHLHSSYVTPGTGPHGEDSVYTLDHRVYTVPFDALSTEAQEELTTRQDALNLIATPPSEDTLAYLRSLLGQRES